MGFNCGIVGLPNVGKSTLFNAVTASHAEASNYPFCTIDSNVGVVAVPEPRLERLAAIVGAPKAIPTHIEFVDIAGLVRGASRGEGLGNQFLARIREVDAIVHLVRCFDDPNVAHVDGSVDPRRDIEVVQAELILKDLDTVERRLGEVQKRAKSGDRKLKTETEFYGRLRDHLHRGAAARSFAVAPGEEPVWMRDMHLLTDKPGMYVCNVHEHDLGRETPRVAAVREIASGEGAPVVTVSAEVEAEIAELAEGERQSFLEGLGVEESGLHKVIRTGYALLHLLTFFTWNAKEARAWTVRQGATAPEAAGKIHTDFERGFIRAEVASFEDLDRFGSEHALREAGLIHTHGRDYVIRDGDVVYFRFNV